MDTRDKRFSTLSLGLPFARVFPNPDGAIDEAAERAHFMPLYAMALQGTATAFFYIAFSVQDAPSLGVTIQDAPSLAVSVQDAPMVTIVRVL